MKWHFTSLSDYPQGGKTCFVATPHDYRLMWYHNQNGWWYDYDTDEAYVKDNREFAWVFLDEIIDELDNG